MKLHLSKTKDGDGYISVLLNSNEQSIVCKPVHGSEMDDLLSQFKTDTELIVEQIDTPLNNEYAYYVSEKQFQYFKGRCIEQITIPTDSSFIKDEGTGYLIKLTGGLVRLKDITTGDDITISAGNLFELINEGLKKWE